MKSMTAVKVCESQGEWDEAILEKGGHPLQLWGWGEVKAAHGWVAERVFVDDNEVVIGAAQVLLRPLPGLFKYLAYIPRGPVAAKGQREAVLAAVAGYVKTKFHATVLTIEPDWEEMPAGEGWQASANTILIPRTLILDLKKSEDELLGHMTKKTRQYIRKSASDGVVVRKVKDREELEVCLRVYRQTAERAQFAIHNDQYYYDVFDHLGEHSPVLVALFEGKIVAFLWLAISSETAFELYGGMNEEGQRLRANYALKWQTIQLMKKWGIRRYDMNGLVSDGVSTFKQGFADHENRLAGTYDKPLSPLYSIWKRGLPLAKKIIRLIKR